MQKIKLSILDQSHIRRGSNAREAIAESSKLVQLADEWGYTRYWVSEHHNISLLAGSTPEVLIAHLAGESKRIRLGSGGIMLPNHSALKVAENFRMLETIFPGRIDLGIGRAPGGDRVTAYLLNPSNNFSEKDFVQQLQDLQGFLTDHAEPGSVQEKVKAIPLADTVPALWILTSSGGSSLFAAHFGMALSFAQFINPSGGPEAVAQYRQHFKPSAQLAEPQVSVGIFGFCSESEEKVKQWQAMFDYRLLRLEQVLTNGLPPIEEILKVKYSPAEQARIAFNRGRMVCGTPAQMQQQLQQLAAEYDADEIVISTMTDDFEDRIQSYRLLATAFHL